MTISIGELSYMFGGFVSGVVITTGAAIMCWPDLSPAGVARMMSRRAHTASAEARNAATRRAKSAARKAERLAKTARVHAELAGVGK